MNFEKAFNKQVALVNRPAIDGEGWAGDRETTTKLFHQCFHNRSDVPLGSRIKSGTVFEIELAATGPLQPAQGSQ